MFRRVEDFKEIWKAEAEKTAAVFAAIPSAALGQAVNAAVLTIGVNLVVDWLLAGRPNLQANR